MLLWQVLLRECGSRCCVSTVRDLKTVTDRVEAEGESFLTITLPTYAQGLQTALERGKVDPSDFLSFSSRRGRGKSAGLPRFLEGFLGQIFDTGSGRIHVEPSIDAITSIRQLTLAFQKLSLPCTPARERKAMNGYITCEEEVRAHDLARSSEDYLRFSRMADFLYSGVYSELNNEFRVDLLRGKHGPGQTADRLKGNLKWDQTEWTWRLERVIPSSGFLVSSDNHWKWLSRLELLDPGQERPVKVISVPKTLKTPRIIAMEPTCMMFVQQALSSPLIRLLESDKFMGGMIGFSDQSVNRQMARNGSLWGDLATLDLSEASDRVSNQLVRALFAWQPRIAEVVDAARSRSADVRNHGVIRLAKYASMGSALTFPIEAMVFLTVVMIGIEDELKRPLTRKDVLSLRGQVRVYGDDIIIPTHYAQSVVSRLSAFGLKVNADKSFWNGSFRESCGGEYFAGDDVTVVRFRHLLPELPKHARKKIRGKLATQVVSAVSLRNQLYLAGYWQTTAWLDAFIGRVIPFPAVAPTSPILGRVSFLGYDTEWTDPKLHRPLVRGYVVSAASPPSPLGGSGALMKCLTLAENKPRQAISLMDVIDSEMPITDPDHLERAGRPQAVSIKLGAHQPY